MKFFQILYEEGDLFELECLMCGETFICNRATGLNVDLEDGESAVCPLCGAVSDFG